MNKKFKFIKPSLAIIFWARFIDVLIISIISAIIAIFLKVNSFISATYFVVAILINFSLFLIIIPLFTKKRTIGKLLCHLHLLNINDGSVVNFYKNFIREFYYIIMPFIVAIILQYIRAWILVSQGESSLATSNVIYSISCLFISFWYIYIMISIKMQDQHLSAIDLKYKMFVLKKEIILKEIIIQEKEIDTSINFPLFIDIEELNKISEINLKDINNKNDNEKND